MTSVRLVGEGLVLREWTAGDLTTMTELFDEPEIAYRTPLPTPFDLVAAQAHLDAAAQAGAGGHRLHLAITIDGDPPLGEVMLNRVSHSISYAVGSRHRGQRLASRAVAVLISYARDVAGIARLYLEIEADNAASMRVAQATGFTPLDAEPSVVQDKGRRYALRKWVRDA